MSGLKEKFNNSLGVKLIFVSTFGMLIIMTAVLVFQSFILKNNMAETQRKKIERLGKLISSASSNPMLSYDFTAIDGFANEIRKDIDVSDVIFNNQTGARVNSENQKDSLTAAEQKFGVEEVKSAPSQNFEFPILADGSKIGTLIIKTHTLELDSLLWGMQLKLSIIFAVGIIALFSLSWFSSKRIVIIPLQKLESIANQLSIGKVNLLINNNRSDELGNLEKSFSMMIDSIKVQATAADKIANGDLKVEIKLRSEEDVLSKSMIKVVETLKAVVVETVTLSNAAIEGKLSTKGDTEKFQGGYKEILQGINQTLEAVAKPIEESSKVLEIMAGGDLTARMTNDYKGDFAIIKNSINNLAASFSSALSDVTESVQATASASNQISSSSEEMAAGAQEQSSQTSEVASAVEQMTKTILETSKNSSIAADAAKNAGAIAKEGGKVVVETIEGMNRIAEVVSKSAATVQALGKSSDQIGEIVQVIDDIADQTNLLALNAAIEAARAGEQGRGFAVVADEVRKLAERTTKATKEIATMIRQIQKDTSGAVASMEEGTKEVERGKHLADKAGESLQQIIKGADQVVDVITQVAAASEEQSSASEQISKNIEAISNVTNESASGVQQIARAAEDLNRLTINLQELVSKFKIQDSSAVDRNLKISTSHKRSNLLISPNGSLSRT